MFDLDAYLERIGLRGEPELATVHRAHATSIPFDFALDANGRVVSAAHGDGVAAGAS